MYYIYWEENYVTQKSARSIVFSRLSSRTLLYFVIGLFASEETEDYTSVFSLINNYICHSDKVLIFPLIELLV